MKSKQLTQWFTKYYADSAEFCPVSPYQDIFVVGTYQLEENETNERDVCPATVDDEIPSSTLQVSHNLLKVEPDHDLAAASEASDTLQIRRGCLYLHRFSGTSVENLQEIEMAGILDMKWSCQRVSSLILLGVVTSAGEIIILKLSESGNSLERLCKETVKTDGALALSLDWSNRAQESLVPHLAVSDSKGYLSVYELNSSSLKLLHQGNCHSFEAWITAFSYRNPDTVYSGGDDCKFKGYDLRIGLEVQSFVCGVHESGVTSCHSNDLQDHLVVTGSYDEVVRVWDDRQWRRPVSEVRVGGGVWRLKWRPGDARCLLAACMYNHFQIINVSAAGSSADVAAKYEHSSLAYGADWCWRDQSPRTLVAASFYDRTVSIFTIFEDT
ncbi:WD40-repeat-containing domain [Trinorchestia longiramus]|nr:WD40-repeat-containing domain [Trinorchestia longiramus]